MAKKTILIIDSDLAAIEAIKTSFAADKAFEVIGSARNGQKGIQLCQIHNPHCVILDLEMIDLRGLEVLKDLKKTEPQNHVLVNSYLIDKPLIAEVLKAKASGFVFKGEGTNALPQILKTVLNGETYLSEVIRPQSKKKRGRRPKSEGGKVLTPFEHQVVYLYSQGMDHQEIGKEVGESTEKINKMLATLKKRLKGKLLF